MSQLLIFVCFSMKAEKNHNQAFTMHLMTTVDSKSSFPISPQPTPTQFRNHNKFSILDSFWYTFAGLFMRNTDFAPKVSLIGYSITKIICLSQVFWTHLSKGTCGCKQKCTQFLTLFSGIVFYALSHGVIRFARSVSPRNHFLT